MAKNKTRTTDKYILIGNGFSIGIHEKFNYASLFDVANLTETEKDLFCESKDFEKTIRNLTMAIKTIEVIDNNKNPLISIIQTSIKSMKTKLLTAIQSVHPTNFQSLLDEKIIQNYIDILEKFRSIYTLNYDLLLYWLLMKKNKQGSLPEQWRDGFRGEPPRWPGNQGVNFFNLHGSLYFINSSNSAFELEKLVGEHDNRILQKVEDKIERGIIPAYVCEGTAQEKTSRIFHSNYLRFAFEKFKNIKGDLFLYGVALGDNDEHIWQAIKENKEIKKLYISYHDNQRTIEANAQKWFMHLHAQGKIQFFQATLDGLNKIVSSD